VSYQVQVINHNTGGTMLGNGMGTGGAVGAGGGYGMAPAPSASALVDIRERIERHTEALAFIVREMTAVVDRAYGANVEKADAQGSPPAVGSIQSIHFALSAQESMIQALQAQVARLSGL
jgi:hypothetical protein